MKRQFTVGHKASELLLAALGCTFMASHVPSVAASSSGNFDRYFPVGQYPHYSESQESSSNTPAPAENLVGDIKNLSAEIQRSVKEVAQKRNLTCFGDPCLFQFFPLAYNLTDSGFFGGIRANLTNIASRDPYKYAGNIQLIRSDTRQWLSAANLDIPELDLKIFQPRVKFRGSYSRSTEFRYTGQGVESYTLAKREDRDKRYALDEVEGGSTVLIPLNIGRQSRFGLYASYDYSVVKTDPYIAEGSILYTEKPDSFEGGTYRSLGMGIYHDTRNNELLPRSGQLIEVGFGLGALDERSNIVYRANLIDRRYFSRGRWTFAHRFTIDGLFGKVPFWETSSVGGIDPIRDVSGSGLLKGARVGRYHEKIKVMEAVELRVHQNEFRAIGQRGDLALVPLAFEVGILSRLAAWSVSTGFDILWNRSFLTRFYASFTEEERSVHLKFNQEF